MAVNVRPFELLGAGMACVFALFGVIHMFRINEPRDTYYVNDFNYVAVGCFLIFFNVVKALVVIYPESEYPKYFGYLSSWVGRGLHFLLMAFYLYPSVCYNSSWSTGECFGHVDILGKVCLICIFLTIILGLFFLFGRFLVGGHDWRSVSSENRKLDPLAVLTLVASACILFYVLLMIWDQRGRNVGFWWYHAYDLSVITFITILGVFSLIASFRVSRMAATYLGFLYYDIGRGLFYFFIGLYMYAMNPYHSRKQTERLLCDSSAVVNIIAGAVCLFLTMGWPKESPAPPVPQTEMAKVRKHCPL